MLKITCVRRVHSQNLYHQIMQSKIIWVNHVSRALVFFLLSILVLSCFRLFFLFYFSDGFTEFGVKNILPALWTGFMVDAKWLSLSIAPAFLLLLISYWKPFLFKYSSVLAIIGLFGMVTLDAINFVFSVFIKHQLVPLYLALYKTILKQ